jgi:hypothetical protein
MLPCLSQVTDGVSNGGPLGALGALSVGGMFKASNTSEYGCTVDECRLVTRSPFVKVPPAADLDERPPCLETRIL